MEKRRKTRQTGERQEADHHGGGHGKMTIENNNFSDNPFSDNLFPHDLVPVCLCLNIRDFWLHSPHTLLLLHPGHPHHAHQDSCQHWPHHLLWAQPSVPVWDVAQTRNLLQEQHTDKESSGQNEAPKTVRMMMMKRFSDLTAVFYSGKLEWL